VVISVRDEAKGQGIQSRERFEVIPAAAAAVSP